MTTLDILKAAKAHAPALALADTQLKNSALLAMAQALEEKGVDFAMHVYRQGRHGLGVANELVYPASQIPAHSWDVPGWLDAEIRFFADCGIKIED